MLLPTNILKSYDPSNKFDPVKSIPNYFDSITLDPGLTKKRDIYLRVNEIWDDDRDFFDQTLRTKFVDFGVSSGSDVSLR